MLDRKPAEAKSTDGHRNRTRRRIKGSRTVRLTALVLSLVSVAALTAASAQAGLTFLPKKIAVETNEKYRHNCFWAPPKGMDYANLPNAIPIQKPNLYPDVGSTYFVAQYKLPPGASLTLKGKFGYLGTCPGPCSDDRESWDKSSRPTGAAISKFDRTKVRATRSR